MEDLGHQVSYLVLKKGVPVFSRDGERLGRVVRVSGDRKAHIFDGIVFDTTAGPGGHRFVDAPEVGQIYERGVVLRLDAAAAAKRGAPGANPGALSVNPADLVGGRPGFFRRAWNTMTGKR
jgi:hypothetical protein